MHSPTLPIDTKSIPEHKHKLYHFRESLAPKKVLYLSQPSDAWLHRFIFPRESCPKQRIDYQKLSNQRFSIIQTSKCMPSIFTLELFFPNCHYRYLHIHRPAISIAVAQRSDFPPELLWLFLLSHSRSRAPGCRQQCAVAIYAPLCLSCLRTNLPGSSVTLPSQFCHGCVDDGSGQQTSYTTPVCFLVHDSLKQALGRRRRRCQRASQKERDRRNRRRGFLFANGKHCKGVSHIQASLLKA